MATEKDAESSKLDTTYFPKEPCTGSPKATTIEIHIDSRTLVGMP